MTVQVTGRVDIRYQEKAGTRRFKQTLFVVDEPERVDTIVNWLNSVPEGTAEKVQVTRDTLEDRTLWFETITKRYWEGRFPTRYTAAKTMGRTLREANDVMVIHVPKLEQEAWTDWKTRVWSHPIMSILYSGFHHQVSVGTDNGVICLDIH